MTDTEWLAFIDAEKVKRKELRKQARGLGMTFTSDHGSSSGWYELKVLAPGKLYCGTPIEGIGLLELFIERIGKELGYGGKPSPDQIYEAIAKVRAAYWQEKADEFDATKDKVCSYCEQPPDGTPEYRVGPEDAYQWVHERCYKEFGDRNERELNERFSKLDHDVWC